MYKGTHNPACTLNDHVSSQSMIECQIKDPNELPKRDCPLGDFCQARRGRRAHLSSFRENPNHRSSLRFTKEKKRHDCKWQMMHSNTLFSGKRQCVWHDLLSSTSPWAAHSAFSSSSCKHRKPDPQDGFSKALPCIFCFAGKCKESK